MNSLDKEGRERSYFRVRGRGHVSIDLGMQEEQPPGKKGGADWKRNLIAVLV